MELDIIVRIAVQTERATVAAQQALELIFWQSLIGIKKEKKNRQSTDSIIELEATVRGELPGDEDLRATLSDIKSLQEQIERESVV